MSETVMSESQRTRCRNIMVGHAESLICGHSDEIMNTLNEIFENSPDDKASLDIPIVLRVKRDTEAGYTFGGKIDIRKIERVKDSVDDIIYNPNLPDLPGFEDGKVPKTKKADKPEVISGDQLKCIWAVANEVKVDEIDIKAGVKEYWGVEHVHDIPAAKYKEVMDWIKGGCPKREKAVATSVPAEKPAKPGDNGAKFVLANRTVDIVDYEDVSSELTSEVLKDTVIAKSMNGDKMVAFTEADLLAKSFKVPGGNFRIIRGKSKDGKTTNYFIQLLPAAESPEPENAPANAPEEKKGKGRGKKKDEAAQAPAPEKQPEEKKPETPRADEEIRGKNIALFLSQNNLSLSETEAHLRKINKLGFTMSLQSNPTAVKYVMDNIEDIKEALNKTA